MLFYLILLIYFTVNISDKKKQKQKTTTIPSQDLEDYSQSQGQMKMKIFHFSFPNQLPNYIVCLQCVAVETLNLFWFQLCISFVVTALCLCSG